MKGLGVNVRFGDGPTYPAVNVAVITAVTLALSPYVVRLLRRMLFVVIVLVGLATMYLGAGYPSDVLGGVLLGIATAALIRVVLGIPEGGLSVAEVRVALADLGFDVADVQKARERVAQAAVMDVQLTSGEKLRVAAFGRDQRDAQVAAKLWRRMMFHEPGLSVLGTRSQQVEHIAYTLLLAERAGVCSAGLVKTGVGGADAALLVTSPPSGSAARRPRTCCRDGRDPRRDLASGRPAPSCGNQPRQPRSAADRRGRRRVDRARRLQRLRRQR